MYVPNKSENWIFSEPQSCTPICLVDSSHGVFQALRLNSSPIVNMQILEVELKALNHISIPNYFLGGQHHYPMVCIPPNLFRCIYICTHTDIDTDINIYICFCFLKLYYILYII